MTLAPTRPRTRPAAPRPTCRLVLEIARTQYQLRALSADAAIGRVAFRLMKEDGTVYDVVQTPYGPECDCPDFVFRRDGLDPDGCKHVQALVAAGMIAGR